MRIKHKRSGGSLREKLFLTFVGFILLVSFSVGTVQALAAKKTVRMWWWGNVQGRAPREEAMKQIISNFETAYPDFKIINEPQVWDKISPKFFAAHQVGNAPDICWILWQDFGLGWKLGAYADLNELFINQWTEDEKKDFFPPAIWNYGVEDGKKYQVTLSQGSNSPVIRKDLFIETGIDYPIKTWDKFIEVAQKLTKDTDGDGKTDVWGFGQPFSLEKSDPGVFVFALADLQEGKIFTKEGKAMWATDAGVKAMRLQTNFVTKDKITPPGSVTYTVEDLYEGMSAGMYAMIMCGAVRIPRMRQNATFEEPSNITFMPPPSWEGGTIGPTEVRGWNIVVSAKSSVKTEAGKFVEWMINPESDRLWLKVAGQMPSRKSTCQDPFFHKPENDYLRIWADAWEKRGWCPFWKVNTAGYTMYLNKAAQQIILEGRDIKQALLEAEKSFNERY